MSQVFSVFHTLVTVIFYPLEDQNKNFNSLTTQILWDYNTGRGLIPDRGI